MPRKFGSRVKLWTFCRKFEKGLCGCQKNGGSYGIYLEILSASVWVPETARWREQTTGMFFEILSGSVWVPTTKLGGEWKLLAFFGKF